MEEAPENCKESSHSAHANGMNEYLYVCAMEGSGRSVVMNSPKLYQMELVHTSFIKTNVADCRFKYKLAIAGYLVLQVTTCQMEVKLCYEFQMSV